MVNRSREKGFRAERELSIILWKNGFACIRGPASGSGGRIIFYPDLVAMRNGKVYVFEIKTSQKNYAYVSKNKLLKLYDFVKRVKGLSNIEVRAIVAVKKRFSGWVFVDLTALNLEDIKGDRINVLEKSFKKLSLKAFLAKTAGYREISF